MFVASRDKNSSSPTPETWSPYIGGRTETVVIDCGHNDMTSREPIAEIGRVLAEKLRDMKGR
jgi:thioesterase domain-containing protein